MATNWTAAREKAMSKVMQTPVNPTQVTRIAIDDADKLCKAIEKAHPDLAPNFALVEAAGAGKSGPQKLAVYTRPANKAEGLKAANVTIYGTGKVVWTNLDPVSL